MSEYGVQPTGFVQKSLSQILAEIEASNITEFGPDVIQTPQSPLGQINGLMANLVKQNWELGHEIYLSNDPDQAEGTRLDTLGRLRLLSRAGNESDEAFRQAITNSGRARIDVQDVVRAVRGLSGVTYAQVFLAEDGQLDEFTVPPGTVAVAVMGGNDAQIAEALRDYVVPGISTFGNHVVSSTIDGYCRSLNIVRPIPVPVKLTVNVRTFKDKLGCPPPSTVAMRGALVEQMTFVNGEDIMLFKLRILEQIFSTVEVISFVGERDGIEQGTNQPVNIGFTEIATLALNDVTVNVV